MFSPPSSLEWHPWNKKIRDVLIEEIKSDGLKDGLHASGCGLRINSKISIDEYNSHHASLR